MKLKYLFVFAVILLITQSAFAISYNLWSHPIDISLNNTGEAEITERFHLFFSSEQDKIEFREKSTELGTDLEAWEEFNEQFTNTIGGKSAVNKKISYNEKEDSYLELKYSLNEPLMARGKETSFRIKYSIKANYFDSLYQSGLWVIPDGTEIRILLPPGGEIEETIEPEARIVNEGTRKKVVWTGYKSGNNFSFNYILWKKLPPIIDLNKTIAFLFRTTEGLVILSMIGLVLAVLLWKRKIISKKIELFVENTTVFEDTDSESK